MNDQQISVEQVIKQLVLANQDGEIKSIAAVTVNSQGEPELHIGLNLGDAYRISTALRLMDLQICMKLLKEGGRPLGDRE
jgi:hypothetical protein